MFEKELIKRDWKEYKQLEPVLEEINRLRAIVERFENAPSKQLRDTEQVLELKAKLQALAEERSELYKGQSITASKLLELSERLETVTKERDAYKEKASELEQRLQAALLKEDFEHVPAKAFINETLSLDPVIEIGILYENSWFGWTGRDFLLDGVELPRVSEEKTRLMYLNSALAIAALEDGSIVLWGRSTCRIKHVLPQGPTVLALDVHGEDSIMVSVHCECLKVWDLRHGSCIRTVNVRMDESKAWVRFSSTAAKEDEEKLRVEVVLGRGKLKVFTLDGQLLKKTQLSNKPITWSAFTNDGILVASQDVIHVYNQQVTKISSQGFKGVAFFHVHQVQEQVKIEAVYLKDREWYVQLPDAASKLCLGSGELIHWQSRRALFPDRIVEYNF